MTSQRILHLWLRVKLICHIAMGRKYLCLSGIRVKGLDFVIADLNLPDVTPQQKDFFFASAAMLVAHIEANTPAVVKVDDDIETLLRKAEKNQ